MPNDSSQKLQKGVPDLALAGRLGDHGRSGTEPLANGDYALYFYALTRIPADALRHAFYLDHRGPFLAAARLQPPFWAGGAIVLI